MPVAQPQSTCLIEWCWGGRRKFNARVVREEARDGAKQPDVGAARPQGREGGRRSEGVRERFRAHLFLAEEQ